MLDFPALVRRHHEMVWRYLRLLGCDAAQSDDLTQETFLAVLQKPFEQRDDTSTAAYLRTVARHLFLMAVRAARCRPAFEDLDAADRVFERILADAAFIDALRECVEELPDPRTRRILDLRYGSGSSGAEIAARLELKEAHVNTLVARAKESLRACVEGKVGA